MVLIPQLYLFNFFVVAIFNLLFLLYVFFKKKAFLTDLSIISCIL